MRRRFISPLALVLLVACAGDRDELATANSQLTNPAVVVDGSGHWRESLCGTSCWWKQFFWVDLDVRNDGYDKQVAILWTDDKWDTSHVKYASYEADRGNGRETWGADVEVGIFPKSNPGIEVEYAVYVKMAGATHWEPYNNHYIYGKVSADQPVRVMASKVGYDADAGGTLSGRVRVFNLAYEKQVTIVYSIDGGDTEQEVEASWLDGGDWTFELTGIGGDTLPDEVQFAVRYRVDGKEFWDKNGGYKYRHRMHPNLSANSWQVIQGEADDEPVSGIITANGYGYTDIPVQRMDVKVGAGAWQLGDLPQPSRTTVFSTHGLSDGEHEVSFRLVLEGGYEATASLSFDVDNKLEPLGAWSPSFRDFAPGDQRGWSYSAAVGDDGKMYFEWEEYSNYPDTPYRGIARFGSFGTNVEPVLYERVPSDNQYYAPTPRQIVVDDAGQVYGSVREYPSWSVWRWDSEGKIDTGFATNGELDLSQELDGHYLEQVYSIAWGADYLWVVGACAFWDDDCDKVVARFDSAGNLVGELIDLPDPVSGGYGYVANTREAIFHGGSLWVMNGYAVVEVAVDAAGNWASGASTTIDGLDQPARGFARTDDGRLFVLEGSQRLLVTDSSGALLGAWYVSSYSQPLLGSARYARSVVVAPDGNIAVLDSDGARLVSFDDTLKP